MERRKRGFITEVAGHLAITSDNVTDYSKLQHVTGKLFIYPDATLDAPALLSTGELSLYRDVTFNAPALLSTGELSIDIGATLYAPMLRHIDKRLYLHQNATLHAPMLTSIKQSIFVDKYATMDTPALEIAHAWISVDRDSLLNIPTLKHVLKLSLYEGASVNAPALTTIDGWLTINPNASLDAPNLSSVAGDLKIYRGAMLHAPLLDHIGGEFIVREGATLRGKTNVLAKPGDTFSQFKRRYISRTIFSPHGRCAHAGYCVEHEVNKRVRACAANKPEEKNS